MITEAQLYKSFNLYNELTYKDRFNKWKEELIKEGYLIQDPDTGNLYTNKAAINLMREALNLNKKGDIYE